MMGSVSTQVVASRVLNSIPEGLALAFFAWVLLRLVGRQNSGTRFAVWFMALGGISLLPFFPMLHLTTPLPGVPKSEVILPASWAGVVLAIWGVVALFGLVRLGFGVMRLASLRRSSVPVAFEELPPALASVLRNRHRTRNCELRVSSEIKVPTAIGFFRPVILLPAWAIGELSPEELSAVVLHESAHLERRDDWTNFAQKVVRALLFFHPAVLWVDRRLSLEREMACDDAVLAATGNPGAYARCLVSMAEKSFVRRTVALAQAAISRAHETSSRIAQILDGDRPTATHVFKPVLAAVAGVVAVALAVIPYSPRLVSFQSPTSVGSAAATEASAPEIPQIPHSMIVPAMARLQAPVAHGIKPALGRSLEQKSSPHRTVRNEVPLYAATALRNRKQTISQAQFLVVTERTDYYQHGDAVVGISTWRVMLVSAPVKAVPQVEPKQT